MDRCGKKSKGWHIAGLILAGVLLLFFVMALVLGIRAFDTADYPTVGTKGFYPADSAEILPLGAAGIADTEILAERGMPVAYFDAETESVRIRYYYGEENGKLVLTDQASEEVIEIEPEALRGCVVSYIPILGYVLAWICTLGGVCTSLAVSMLLVFAIILILSALLKVIRHNRAAVIDEVLEECINEDQMQTNKNDEKIQTETILETETTEKPMITRINDRYTVEVLEEAPEGVQRMVFRGEASDILKLAKIIRTAAEKKQITSITVEERYDEECELKVTAEEKDMPLVTTIINMLGEQK